MEYHAIQLQRLTIFVMTKTFADTFEELTDKREQLVQDLDRVTDQINDLFKCEHGKVCSYQILYKTPICDVICKQFGIKL